MSGSWGRSIVLAGFALVACTEAPELPARATFGPNPVLPPPQSSLLPTVDIAPARGWQEGETPRAAEGLEVAAFATGLDHPRWLHVLPNGDVLVAETNAPADRESPYGPIRSFFMKQVMQKAGAATPSADRITLLRDGDGDGIAETRSIFLQGLYSPFGMALTGADLYVANANGVVRFPYRDGVLEIAEAGVPLTDLPAGMNHHWTKNIVATAEGDRLYAAVGSNSNVGESGMAVEEGRAAIWEIDLPSGEKRLFATGLRNPVGLDFEPETGVLWTAVNERDEFGKDVPPDYLTRVRQGGFYGWPYSYFGQNLDPRVEPQRPDLVRTAIQPDYALGAHTASLGLAFANGARLGPGFASGAFVGQHGSWNRTPKSGYKVVFIPFEAGMPAGDPVDVLTGFLSPDGDALGRPVGVAVAADGALLVADDVGNAVWRVSAAR